MLQESPFNVERSTSKVIRSLSSMNLSQLSPQAVVRCRPIQRNPPLYIKAVNTFPSKTNEAIPDDILLPNLDSSIISKNDCRKPLGADA